MPELPEVETIRRGLDPLLTGRNIIDVETGAVALRTPFPERLREKLSGRRIAGTCRRAKYLGFRLDTGALLVLHLGMSGRIRLEPSAGARAIHDHLAVTLDDGLRMILNDPRRFGSVLFFDSAAAMDSHPSFRWLGPEPLAENFSGPALSARLQGRKVAIKQALMDQKIVAGVGNIYASEALFRARIAPFRAAASIGAQEGERLTAALRAVLEDAIAAGGSSLKDYRQADGSPGYFQEGFSVYNRQGRPCPGCICGGEPGGGIVKTVQGGRATYYCPRVQQ